MQKMFLAFYFFTLLFTSSYSSYAASGTSPFSHGLIFLDCQNEKLLNKDPERQDVCISDRIIPESEITYFQALKKIYPDLQSNGKASVQSAIRIAVEGLDDSAPVGTTLEATQGQKISMSSWEYSLAKGNLTQLIILSRGEGSSPVLAFFKMDPALKLLDLIDVNLDRWVSIGNFLFTAKQTSPLFIIMDSHNNSSQWYVRYSLWMILNDKLQKVYDGPNLSGQRIPQQNSCYTQAKLEKISPLKTDRDGFSDIQLTLSRSKICEDEKTNKEKKISGKIYPASLIWDAKKQKYMGGSKAFVKEDPFTP